MQQQATLKHVEEGRAQALAYINAAKVEMEEMRVKEGTTKSRREQLVDQKKVLEDLIAAQVDEAIVSSRDPSIPVVSDEELLDVIYNFGLRQLSTEELYILIVKLSMLLPEESNASTLLKLVKDIHPPYEHAKGLLCDDVTNTCTSYDGGAIKIPKFYLPGPEELVESEESKKLKVELSGVEAEIKAADHDLVTLSGALQGDYGKYYTVQVITWTHEEVSFIRIYNILL
jgi:hypothetical protein